MRKQGKAILAWTMIFLTVFTFIPFPKGSIVGGYSVEAEAATTDDMNQSSVFVMQADVDTCTLASAVMMLRRSAILRGDKDWATITEASTKDGSGMWCSDGLYHNFKYRNIQVRYKYIDTSLTLQQKTDLLIQLLKQNPQGIEVFRPNTSTDPNKPNSHAVLLTDYTNGQFYVADPYRKADRVVMSASTTSISVANIGGYWYVESYVKDKPVIYNPVISDVTPAGYTVSCYFAASRPVTGVYLPTWNSDTGTGDTATWLLADINGNIATFHVTINDLKNGKISGNYQSHIYVYDNYTNEKKETVTDYSMTAIPSLYIDNKAPVISEASVVEQDSQGYLMKVKVSDNYALDRVQFPTWTIYGSQDDIIPGWEKAATASGTYIDGYYYYRVKTSDHNGEFGSYATHVYAYDTFGNATRFDTSFNVNMTAGYKTQSMMYGGHEYTLFEETLSAADMKALAAAMGGTLAVITSDGEQKAVAALAAKGNKSQYALGGSRTKAVSAFSWDTKEAMTYTAWTKGEPDNLGKQDYLMAMDKTTGSWKDVSELNFGTGFIVEMPLTQTPVKTITTANSVYEIYNSHMTVEAADLYCRTKGGHLVTITSSGENTTLKNALADVGNVTSFFTAGSDAQTEGTFAWSNGEAFSYKAWAKKQPDNAQKNGGENYLMLMKDGTWQDAVSSSPTASFILEYDIKPVATVNSSLSKTTYTYDGTAKTPKITLKYGAYTLVSGKDYQAAYAQNIGAGTAKVNIVGLGHFTGSNTLNFSIQSKSITTAVLSLQAGVWTYDGTAKKPAVTVMDQSRLLVNGTDYTVGYANNVNAGTATVTVTGKGNYTGSLTTTFQIGTLSLAGMKTALSKTAFTYTGKNLIPSATIMNGLTPLVAGRDFTLSYTGNKNPGIAKAVITGVGNYSGSTVQNFTIAPPPVTVTILSGVKKATLSWKKSTGATGYVIYAATSSTGSYKKIYTTSASALSYTQSGLATGSTKYYKVKALWSNGRTQILSASSKAVSVKIK